MCKLRTTCVRSFLWINHKLLAINVLSWVAPSYLAYTLYTETQLFQFIDPSMELFHILQWNHSFIINTHIMKGGNYHNSKIYNDVQNIVSCQCFFDIFYWIWQYPGSVSWHWIDRCTPRPHLLTGQPGTKSWLGLSVRFHSGQPKLTKSYMFSKQEYKGCTILKKVWRSYTMLYAV